MFSKEPNLYIGGKRYYGTLFGFIITIIAVLICFICGAYFIYEMFDTKNVSSVTSVKHPSNPLSINFTSDKFYFTFALEDPNTYVNVFDESIYTVNGFYKIATRHEDGNISWESYPVELEPCQIEKFNPRYYGLFLKRNIHKKYCVKNFTYNIEGTYLHDKYSFLIFNFYQCKNTTMNPIKCKSQE